jgi:hypothetical protein
VGDPGRGARRGVWRRVALVMLGALAAACGGDDNLLSPGLRDGTARIWEVSAQDFPSAFDVVAERRLFLGSGDINSSLGDFFLDGPVGSTDLRLRSIASLLRLEPVHAVRFQDLGTIDFEALETAPQEGYTDSEDPNGVGAFEGHVYVMRITRSGIDDNFAKLIVDSIGSTDGDIDRQFIDFRFVVQTEPGNPRFNLNP